MPKKSSTSKTTRAKPARKSPVWPHNRKTRTVRPQDPDDPQPRPPEGSKQRGGKQTADELKQPPTRPGKNGGTLRTGGTNKGGNGATPSVLRSRCRDTLAINKIFRVPRKILLSKKSTNKEKMEAWKALAQYGGLAALSITDADGNPLELPAFVVTAMDKRKKGETPVPMTNEQIAKDSDTW